MRLPFSTTLREEMEILNNYFANIFFHIFHGTQHDVGNTIKTFLSCKLQVCQKAHSDSVGLLQHMVGLVFITTMQLEADLNE